MITSEIKCPNCGYGGEDLKVGRRDFEVIPATGLMKMKCSACNNEFKIKFMFDCY